MKGIAVTLGTPRIDLEDYVKVIVQHYAGSGLIYTSINNGVFEVAPSSTETMPSDVYRPSLILGSGDPSEFNSLYDGRMRNIYVYNSIVDIGDITGGARPVLKAFTGGCYPPAAPPPPSEPPSPPQPPSPPPPSPPPPTSPPLHYHHHHHHRPRRPIQHHHRHPPLPPPELM